MPGPFIRVTQADPVNFTLVNKEMMPHGMDFHAATITPGRASPRKGHFTIPGRSTSRERRANETPFICTAEVACHR